jgi:hypothetical protein
VYCCLVSLLSYIVVFLHRRHASLFFLPYSCLASKQKLSFSLRGEMHFGIPRLVTRRGDYYKNLDVKKEAIIFLTRRRTESSSEWVGRIQWPIGGAWIDS